MLTTEKTTLIVVFGVGVPLLLAAFLVSKTFEAHQRIGRLKERIETIEKMTKEAKKEIHSRQKKVAKLVTVVHSFKKSNATCDLAFMVSVLMRKEAIKFFNKRYKFLYEESYDPEKQEQRILKFLKKRFAEERRFQNYD